MDKQKIVKLFTEQQLYVGTFLGGPIVAGIIAFKNFKRLGEPKKAELSILLTILFTVLLMLAIFKLPEHLLNAIPNYLIPLLYSVIIAFVFKKFQGEKLAQFFHDDGQKESNWKVAGISGIGLLATLFFVFQLAMFEQPFPGDKLSFYNNDIYFDEAETSEDEVKLLADELFNFGYFDQENSAVVHLTTLPSAYIVTLPVDKAFWDDAEIIEEINFLKNSLQAAFGKNVNIKFEHYELTGETLEKTF